MNREKMPIILTLKDDLHGLQKKVEAFLVPYSMQLFRRNKQGEIEPWASSLLVTYQGGHYAISAGHIFDDCPPEEIGSMIGNEWIDLSVCGNLIAFSPIKNRELEEIDLAVWKLNDEGMSVLKQRWQFYPLYDKDFERIDFENTYHFFFGYPWRKTDVRKYDLQIVSVPFFLMTTIAKKEKFAAVRAQPDLHVLLNFNRNTTISFTSKQQVIAPHPEGMSGCGLWVLSSPYIENLSVDNVKLAGVLTHYFSGHDVIVANRLSHSKPLLHAIE